MANNMGGKILAATGPAATRAAALVALAALITAAAAVPHAVPAASGQAAAPVPAFVDPGADPQTYVDRYNSDDAYRSWFDENYPEYSSIYAAVGLPEPAPFVDPGADPQTYSVSRSTK